MYCKNRGKIIHLCCDECQSHASRSSSLELSSCRGGKVLPPFDTLKIIVNLNIVHCLSPYSGTEYFMGWDEIDYLVLLSHSSKWHELTKWPHCPVTLQKAENGVMGETKGWIIYESTIHKQGWNIYYKALQSRSKSFFFSRTSLNFHQPSHGQAKSRLSENLQYKQELRLLSTVTLSGNKDCLEFRFSIVRIAIRI